MPFIEDTQKSVEQAANAVEEAAKRHGFGVLHTYDFKATLHAKGFDIQNECRVMEICNPKLASDILRSNMTVNMALPCRVSVYEEAGQTKIGMIPPTELLALISSSVDLQEAAKEVEKTVTTIIHEAL